MFYTDLCCSEREYLCQKFPSLVCDNGVKKVLLDVWHFMERYPVSKRHYMYSLFAGSLRDAIFICSEEDLMAVKSVLTGRNVSAE